MIPKLYWVISAIWNYSEVKKNTSENTTPSHGNYGKLPDCIYSLSILIKYGLRKPNNFTELFRTLYLATGSNTITVASCDLLDNYAITLKHDCAKLGADVTGPRHWVKRSWSHHRILCTPKARLRRSVRLSCNSVLSMVTCGCFSTECVQVGLSNKKAGIQLAARKQEQL